MMMTMMNILTSASALPALSIHILLTYHLHLLPLPWLPSPPSFLYLTDNWSPVRSMPEVLDAILSIFDEDHTASDLHCSQGSPRDNQDMQYKDTNQKVSAYDDDVKSVLLTNPCHQTPDSALENLAFDILLSVCHYLTTNDISCLACANKRMLTVTYR